MQEEPITHKKCKNICNIATRLYSEKEVANLFIKNPFYLFTMRNIQYSWLLSILEFILTMYHDRFMSVNSLPKDIRDINFQVSQHYERWLTQIYLYYFNHLLCKILFGIWFVSLILPINSFIIFGMFAFMLVYTLGYNFFFRSYMLELCSKFVTEIRKHLIHCRKKPSIPLVYRFEIS